MERDALDAVEARGGLARDAPKEGHADPRSSGQAEYLGYLKSRVGTLMPDPSLRSGM
jgi:hypothetical protein